MRRVKSSKFLAPLFILWVAATSTAFACKLDPSAAFLEDFKKPDPQWQVDDKITYFVDGQYAIKSAPGTGNSVWMKTFTFKNATYCTDVKTPPDAVDPDTTSNAGFIFWKTDNNNYYLVAIYADGNYLVTRLANDAWTNILPKTKFEKLKAGPGAVNEIKVTTLNNVVTLFFNGEKAIEFRAQAPKDGGQFGVYAQSVKDQRNEWRFLSIVVNE